jgi:Transposase DDE domain
MFVGLPVMRSWDLGTLLKPLHILPAPLLILAYHPASSTLDPLPYLPRVPHPSIGRGLLEHLSEFLLLVGTAQFPRFVAPKFWCRRSPKALGPPKDLPRTLTLQPKEEHEVIQFARRRQKTEEFASLYCRRAGIEGTVSQGIRAFGLRQARYRGLKKTHLQELGTRVRR